VNATARFTTLGIFVAFSLALFFLACPLFLLLFIFSTAFFYFSSFSFLVDSSLAPLFFILFYAFDDFSPCARAANPRLRERKSS
jgi:hypothetical protein